MAFYPGRELANDPTNWWGPNEHCMQALLLGHGFKEIEISSQPAGLNRPIFHVCRSKEAELSALAEENRLKPFAEAKWLEYEKRHPILGRIGAALGFRRRMLSLKSARISR